MKMTAALIALALLALASVVSACAPATLLYCIAVDGDANRKCN